jgi:hypothetical protein
MLGRIARIVEQLKQNWGQELEDEAIRRAMEEAGHKWRKRELDPVTTFRLFTLQILFGNVACNFVPHLGKKNVTGSAYCAARGRLPLPALQSLLTRCTAKMAEHVRDTGRWLGHRLWLVDGSSFSMSDTDELREHFGQSGAQATGCGFPTAHWMALVHFATGLIQRALTSPLRSHDMSQVAGLHPELESGDVLAGDRAFCSYAHLGLLISRGIQGIFRAHQKLIIDFTPGRAHREPGQKHKGAKKKAGKTRGEEKGRGPAIGIPHSRWIKKLGPLDQIVEWYRPSDAPSWMTADTFAALPETLQVRELRYAIGRPGFRVKEVTLVTTLLDPERYPAEELARAYGLRWTIETCFAHIKTTMKMDVLRCQTVRGVLKELTMFLLVYNIVRMTMLEAARRQDVPVDRISFVDALRWLATAQAGDELPDLVINRLRPNRAEPRVRKRRPKQYPLMTISRGELRKALLGLEVAA